ncbi:MAG: precorrin-3B C(17)-methyltransferase [Halodesulfovibrio sp.]
MTGTLKVVGLGPGDAALLTPQAYEALRQADVIVGYTLYVALVPEELKTGKEIIATGMMGEMARCSGALDCALEGRNTAIVCSGDPGIYAMAGLVFELVEERGEAAAGLDVQIIAGIPALSAAAALLGAPLMHDFASVSLSDLLTPWEVIEKRLACAAEGDFVIVLYNPKSKKRDWQLPRALEIIGAHRDKATPVGIVRQANRAEQAVITTTLADFDPAQVDMLSIIIIGNGSTRMIGGRMVTPRGYMDKYRQ